MAETISSNAYSFIKDLFSKHIILCKDDACSAGEMVFHKNDNTGKYKLIFDNASGSFKPSAYKLHYIKDALPYLDVETISVASKKHSQIFE